MKDAKDYPISLNPAYQESTQEYAWLSGRTETEDLGEGYTVEIEFFLREDHKEIEIKNLRAFTDDMTFPPTVKEITETAKEHLKSLYGDKIEFV